MANSTSSYLIQDVPIEISLHISKMVNSSPSPLTLDSILQGMQGIAKQTYVRRGLGMALQMRMIESTGDNTYKGTEKFKEDFRKILISGFPVIARKALQDYPPFLLYLENVMMGYSSIQAATIVSGIFNLDAKNCSNFFKKSGMYAEILIENDGNVELIKSVSTNSDYLENIKKMLNSDLEAKNLISSLLSSEVVTYYSTKGIDFNRPAKALIEIKSDPKASLYKVFEFAETCLYAFGSDVNANVQKANGITELVDAVRSQKAILANPTNLGKGLGGLRNMSNHGPDKETGKVWIFTEETALGAALLIFRYLRSIYLQNKHGVQEI